MRVLEGERNANRLVIVTRSVLEGEEESCCYGFCCGCVYGPYCSS